MSNYTVSDAGQVILIRCENIRVEDLNLSRTDVGIELWETSNSTISANNITANNDYGIWLESSSNYNSIVGNDIKNNGEDGIAVYSSNCNNISGNNITANNRYGIVIESSSYNSIVGNDIKNNGDNGIALRYSSNYNSISGNNIKNNRYGIWLYYSNYNNISGNNMTANNDYGIHFWGSFNNSIVRNNIKNNTYGIWLSESSNNKIYHNNFIDNTYQAYSYYSNVWDDGYPSGGNYWSNYIGVDVKSGSNQDLPGSDGIGDTPYVIDADNVDHYPLMVPYGAPPPATYTLTITATVGGTTDPAPGTYSYTENSTVQVTAIPDAGYLFDYWELDGANVGSANPFSVNINRDIILKAVFTAIPPTLSASINPLSASILVGQSVTFTSTVSGGYPPYTYQWYLNGNPVSGATSDTWTFTPTESGIFYVYLKVTDAKGNTAQSETARITVSAVPVGGYSILIQQPTTTKPITPYITLLAILTAIFTTIKRKTKRKH